MQFSVFGPALIEQATLSQMYQAMAIPVAKRGALMPDAHVGYALPIGGVIELDGAVSPSFVGYDISCMMAASWLPMQPDDLLAERTRLAEALRSVTSFGLGAAFAERREHPVMDDARWQVIPAAKALRELAANQLGSSGGGNHFADLMEYRLAQSYVGDEGPESGVVLLTHSGSRGAGHKLATHYVALAEKETRQRYTGIPKGYEWLNLVSEAGREYMAAMSLMGDYALANHQCIHQAFCKAIGVKPTRFVWNRHNYAWESIHGGVTHRKGATPAHSGQIGIIPGTSGTNSYIVKGKGNADALWSASHGAGRPFSRTEAKRRHDASFVADWMAQSNILSFGLAPDEALTAYKDIDAVMAAQTELVEIVGTLIPRVVIMGGKSDDGD